MDRLLELFASLDRRATLFFLGDFARHHPGLVKRAAAAGHEIASHGNMHERLHRLAPDTLQQDLADSRKILEDLAGAPVLGFRAPTWSVTRQTAWALDVIAEAGFAYDASIFPVHHPWYGVPDAPDRPFFVRGRDNGPCMLELPPLTLQLEQYRLAVAGGGYFRLLPLALMKWGLRQAARDKRPAILYFHPWEFDPGFPRLPLSTLGRIRTCTGRRRSLAKLKTILELPGTWRPIADDLHLFRALAGERQPMTLLPGSRHVHV